VLNNTSGTVASPHVLVAVDHQFLAGDETGFAGEHEHDRLRDVLGLAQALQRNSLFPRAAWPDC
jgi:hypothetical protein